MRPVIKIAGVASVIAVLMIAFIFWSSHRAPKPAIVPIETEPLQAEQAAPETIRQPIQSPTQTAIPKTNPVQEEVESTEEADAAPTPATWQEKVDDVLTGSGEPADKVKALLAVFPTLPEEGQVEAVKHLENLTADEDYPKLGNYLTNATTTPEVLDELMADLLNRPNSMKLPTLLEIARNPQHPKAPEARETLSFFLDGDYGDDWNLWAQKVAEWLKTNPD